MVGMAQAKPTGDEAKDIIKSARLEPIELALTCLMNGLFLGWSIVDLSVCVFVHQQATASEVQQQRLAVDLLRAFFAWKPVAPFISHLMMLIVPLVFVPIMDAWKHGSRLVRGVVIGPARTQSTLVLAGFAQLVVLIAVLVAFVMPAEVRAASLPAQSGPSVDSSVLDEVVSVSYSLVVGHSVLNLLAIVGISILFFRWAWSASDEELALLQKTIGPETVGSSPADPPAKAGEAEGRRDDATGAGASSEGHAASGREASAYGDAAQWKVKGKGGGKGDKGKGSDNEGEKRAGGSSAPGSDRANAGEKASGQLRQRRGSRSPARE